MTWRDQPGCSDSLETIKCASAYRIGSKRYDYVPNDIETFDEMRADLRGVSGLARERIKSGEWKKLPAKARAYLKAIAELTAAKLTGMLRSGLRGSERFSVSATARPSELEAMAFPARGTSASSMDGTGAGQAVEICRGWRASHGRGIRRRSSSRPSTGLNILTLYAFSVEKLELAPMPS